MVNYKIKGDVIIDVDEDVVELLDRYIWRFDKNGRLIGWVPERKISIGLIKYVWQHKTDEPYTKQVKRIDDKGTNYRFSNFSKVKTKITRIEQGVALIQSNEMTFKVDAKFANEVMSYNWRNDGKGYLRTGYYGDPEGQGCYIPLHQYIYFLEYGSIVNGYYKGSEQIDHIDRDPTNNTLLNLRAVDLATNNHNRVLRPGETGYNFIHLFNRHNKQKYQVILPRRLAKDQISKVFVTLEEALEWRDKHLLS